jgi:hypothetical protein
VEARCLFLFEAAGGKAITGGKTDGSGFVSRNNDDASAQKFFDLNDSVLDRRLTISWNIVPWALRENNSEGSILMNTAVVLQRHFCRTMVCCSSDRQRRRMWLPRNPEA